MKNIRVGTATLNQTPMDWKGNLNRVIEAMDQADDKGIKILCLPELCITGYGCEDMFLSSHIQDMALQSLDKIREVSHNTVLVGLPIWYHNSLYNCMAVIQRKRIVGIVPKQNLAMDGIHYEPRWFTSWKQGEVTTIQVGHSEIPFGDLIFELDDGIRFGFEICEDAWVAERVGSSLAKRGADIIFNPSASHFAIGKHPSRQRIAEEATRAFGCTFVHVNLVGNESGKIIFDGSSIIASGGTIIQEGPRFSLKDVNLTYADVDIEKDRVRRTGRSGFDPIQDESPASVVPLFGKGSVTPVNNLPLEEDPYQDPYAEFEAAIGLGLFDYMRKSGTSGFVISLSGGADSSACAVLVASMVQRVNAELEGSPLKVEDILTTAYQSTRNSSNTTSEAARELASELGSKHLHLDVDALVESYKEVVGESLGLDWNWDEHDITLQNIQARVRSPSIWMIANIENKILLATSNRSEASCGYATADGDMSGGLSPIAGIDKIYLRKWLRHKENEVPALQLVNVQQPTAELRPEEEGQTDEEDLMPYDVLNSIENLALLEKKSPLDIWRCLQSTFPDHSKKELGLWTIRFFQLWSRNQWKREKTAVSFHLDDKSVDPKSWCRFPILSSGYQEELAHLSEVIQRNDS